MELDLGLVADFLALVAEQHYGRAAARRHLTASALTKRIQRLERQVGCSLVERGPTGVTAVSPAGRRFAASAGPLLAEASAARRAAHAEARPLVVRLGIPAGTGAVLAAIDARRIVAALRASFPELRITVVEVPFPDLTTCLPARRVDHLFTNAAVPHRAVESYVLPVRSGRVALVGGRHQFADAPAVSVEDLVETPILCNPAVPEANMSPLWLCDLRGRQGARLVGVDARKQEDFLRELMTSDAALVTFPIIAGPTAQGLTAIRLSGAPLLPFYVACRSDDQRGAVRALVGALSALPATTLGPVPRQARFQNVNAL